MMKSLCWFTLILVGLFVISIQFPVPAGYAKSTDVGAGKLLTTPTPKSVVLKPVAGFKVYTIQGKASLVIHIHDASSGSPTSWQWSFGDGTRNATTRDVTHTFTKAGYYNVVLTVTNAKGRSSYKMRIKVG